MTTAASGFSSGLTVGWLGRQDSNLGSRDQNPLPYHLATPHRESASVVSSPFRGPVDEAGGRARSTAKTPAVTKVSTLIQYQSKTTTTASACEAAAIQESSRPRSESSVRPASR